MAHLDPAAIHAKLSAAYRSADRTIEVPAGDEKVIVLSDQHKGARDGADDFQRSERSYNAALAYYNRLKFRLILLGDVEELWENEFDEVAKNYPYALGLEAEFHNDGRYTRVFGNHDLLWKNPDKFQAALRAYGLGDVTPLEAVRLTVKGGPDGDRELFLTHGHQGTKDSDRFARLSQFAVRRGWRWAQNLLDRPWNSPSMDWNLRGKHAEAMASWAASERRVMIAGHTHQPVFWRGRNKPEADPDKVETPANVGDPDEAEALRLARVEWAKAEQMRLKLQQPIEQEKPWYFNTGCCSFGDGDITGIEIDGGEIRLVRWPSRPDVVREPPLAALPLTELFAELES